MATAPVSPQIGSFWSAPDGFDFDENADKTWQTKMGPPLITVWLEVRVLPGPPNSRFFVTFANKCSRLIHVNHWPIVGQALTYGQRQSEHVPKSASNLGMWWGGAMFFRIWQGRKFTDASSP